MEKKKVDFAKIAGDVGKGASDLFGKAKNKAVQIMDQDGDGKFDKADVSLVASAVSDSVKKAANAIKESADEHRKTVEKNLLQPFFDIDVEATEFSLPKLIRLCERDRKRAESEVCQGSIGYYSDHKEIKLVNIFYDSLDKFGITFFPDNTYEFYYVDPRDRDRYIALDEYFAYLKVERINELQRVAQELGARHFRVTYKEEKTELSNNIESKGAKFGKFVEGSINKNIGSRDYTTVEIAAEMDCPGHQPSRPTLRYLWKDTSIENLISLRMDERAPLSHQIFLLKMSNSSGIKENDAVKIDAVLKSLKGSVHSSMVSEVKNESRRYLEYEIDF